MPEYMILFHLPLNPGTKISRTLDHCGWNRISNSTYCRVVGRDIEDVARYIREICSLNSGPIAGRAGNPFVIVPLRKGSPKATCVA